MTDPYRAQLLRLAYARDATASGLDDGFAVYREMIRGRLLGLAELAYRRSWALLGARACAASFMRFLAASPPASPLVREVVHGFAAFACADALGEATPYARDLLRFEAAKWEVSDLAAAPAGEVAELDFEGIPVLNPTLRVLALGHRVDDAEQPPEPAPHALLVYRRDGHDDVRWYRVEPWFGALLARLSLRGESLGAALPGVLAERQIAANEAFVAALTGSLELAIERGVVLGVRSSVS